MIPMSATVAQSADGAIARHADRFRQPLRLDAPTYSNAVPRKVRVRVAHSIPLVALGISFALAKSGDFDLSLSGAPGLSDVLVADVETGLRAMRDGAHSGCVVLIAEDDGEVAIRKSIESGARGLLLQSCAVEELADAVKTVSRGGTAFAGVVASRLAESVAHDPLTPRETEVLQLMVRGLSDKDMARKLAISPGTVKSHMKGILTKLGAARRTEAAAVARRRGLVRDPSLIQPL